MHILRLRRPNQCRSRKLLRSIAWVSHILVGLAVPVYDSHLSDKKRETLRSSQGTTVDEIDLQCSRARIFRKCHISPNSITTTPEGLDFS